MHLTWKPNQDGLELTGLPTGAIGSARRSDTKGYVAQAFIGTRYLSHNGGTLAAAVAHLEAEIDRRSIGLFGVDDVTFGKEPVV